MIGHQPESGHSIILVQAQLRATAIYQGRRNYLLGDQDHPNSVLLILDKSANALKVSQIEGLRPLSFEEGFLKLLGAQIGLPLTATERLEKEKACMPCRNKKGRSQLLNINDDMSYQLSCLTS